MPDTHETGLREHMLMASRFLRIPAGRCRVRQSRALAKRWSRDTNRPARDRRGAGAGPGPTGAIVERIARARSCWLSIWSRRLWSASPPLAERGRVCASAAELEKLVHGGT